MFNEAACLDVRKYPGNLQDSESNSWKREMTKVCTIPIFRQAAHMYMISVWPEVQRTVQNTVMAGSTRIPFVYLFPVFCKLKISHPEYQ